MIEHSTLDLVIRHQIHVSVHSLRHQRFIGKSSQYRPLIQATSIFEKYSRAVHIKVNDLDDMFAAVFSHTTKQKSVKKFTTRFSEVPVVLTPYSKVCESRPSAHYNLGVEQSKQRCKVCFGFRCSDLSYLALEGGKLSRLLLYSQN